MSILKRILGTVEERDLWNTTQTSQHWVDIGLGRNMTSGSGVDVDEDKALVISAFFGCVQVITDAVSTLPVDFVEKKGAHRYPVEDMDVFWLYEQPLITFKAALTQILYSMLVHGNAFVATLRDDSGNVLAIFPLDPGAVTVHREGMDVEYEVDGSRYTRYDILHIPGLSKPGELVGISVLEAARESLGLSYASQDYAGQFFSNGAMPGLVIEVDETTTEDERESLRQQKNAMLNAKSGNAHGIAVLTGGARMKTLSLPPKDVQFIETRAFQVVDIARFFGVPPHLLGHADVPNVGNALQALDQDFVRFRLRALVGRVEDAFTWLLHSEGNDRNIQMKLNLDAFLRGTPQEQAAVDSTLVTAGIITINEARANRDLAPVDWGDRPVSVQVQWDETQDFDPNNGPSPGDTGSQNPTKVTKKKVRE